MYDCVGWIVRSAAGRDKGGLFCVVGQQGAIDECGDMTPMEI